MDKREKVMKFYEEIRATTDPFSLLQIEIRVLEEPRFSRFDKMNLIVLIDLQLRDHPIPPLTPAQG